MLENLFSGLFDTASVSSLTPGKFILCLIVSLALGLGIAFAYQFKSRYTQSFVVTLALLPAVVSVVIMLVNGNLGTGVAVAGAFSLVRFRSAPGSAKEICAIFLAMGSGLITGMGYLAYATLFTVILCGMFLLYSFLKPGSKKNTDRYKVLSVTIPEDLDYSNVFDTILDKYTESRELVKVKTTNMGSMFRLTYDIVIRDNSKEKEMIDALRCRNGNLEITVSKQDNSKTEL